MSNKLNNELSRLRTLIGSDRMNVSDEFQKLLMADLKKLLSDYFELEEKIDLDIKKAGDRYSVIVSAGALRIKNFSIIPK